MSKWLNELNIINLNLYIFHILITWGVMTSHIISIGSKLIESQEMQHWSLEQFMKEY